MSAQTREVTQQEQSGALLRQQGDPQSPRHDSGQATDKRNALQILAQSVGNNTMTEMLDEGHSGAPLEPTFRAQMENTLGMNFENVRVRDDGAAHASAASLDAAAYTVGEEIVLGSNAPSDKESERQDLLAHELIHVVQRRKASATQPTIGSPGDGFEREANSASRQARTGQTVNVAGGGTVPGLQRQLAGTVTKKVQVSAASREEVRQAILAFLQKAQAAQGGSGLRMSDAVKNALRMLATAAGQDAETPTRVQSILRMDSLLSGSTADPADLANRAAQILPEPFERAALDKLQTMPTTDPEKSTMGRVADLAKKEFSKPDNPPNDLQPSPDKRLQDEVDKMRAARGLPVPRAIGPASVDIFALGRFIQKLPGTVKPRTQTASPQAQSYPEVDQAIQKISANLLIPSEARGKEEEGNFADAREVAADLARKLDVAQQEQRESIELRLPPNYNQVKDRAAMIAAVLQIVQAVRQALPHHASAVKYVDVYFGDRLVSRSVGNPSQ